MPSPTAIDLASRTVKKTKKWVQPDDKAKGKYARQDTSMPEATRVVVDEKVPGRTTPRRKNPLYDAS